MRSGSRKHLRFLLTAAPRGLLRVALSHLAFVRSKGSQNLPFLSLRHLEEVKRSTEFSRNFVELGGRDLQFAMGFLQAERSAAGSRSCILRFV